MENLLQDTNQMINHFETTIKNKVDSFKGLADSFRDLLPQAKEKKIKEHSEIILSDTSKFLDSTQLKLNSYQSEVEGKTAKLIYPLRSSSITSNQTAGESQFQSAFNLVNGKNEKFIKSELKKSLSNSYRNDFSFSAFEIIRNSEDFKPTFKDEIGNMFNSHMLAKDYTLSEKVKANLNEIQNEIGYYKRAVSNGKLDANYSINKNIRQR